MADLTPDQQLADEVAKFYADPLGFVLFAFEWDTDPQLQVCRLPAPWSLIYGCEWGPDQWACEFLEALGEQIRKRGFDGHTAVEAIRMARASGHGIGKSALVGMLVCFLMSTRAHCRGTVTANTVAQLETKTWAEITKWKKRCITGHWFEINTSKMYHRDHPESWFCAAQTCREENSESFAGQHNVTSTSFYIFDEASAVPDIIDEVSEGGMTDGEPMKFAFGNPTRNTGWFHRAFHGQRHRWDTKQIDSRSVQITNKKTLDEWIEDYGIDSDFVKVRVRGMFPSMSMKQYISVADVDAAFGRELHPRQYQGAAKVLTVDPAWEGDDEFVIGLRQGLHFQILRTIAKNDNDIEMANLIARLEDEHEADAVIIDAGYGTGIASAGKTMGRHWFLVWFSGESPDPGCLNMRAFMYQQGRDWLKAGGAIPPDPVLHDELIAVETVARLDGKLQIEAKKDLKKRGLQSPNRADTLMLSFAINVTKKSRRQAAGAVKSARVQHDPLAQMAGRR